MYLDRETKDWHCVIIAVWLIIMFPGSVPPAWNVWHQRQGYKNGATLSLLKDPSQWRCWQVSSLMWTVRKYWVYAVSYSVLTLAVEGAFFFSKFRAVGVSEQNHATWWIVLSILSRSRFLSLILPSLPYKLEKSTQGPRKEIIRLGELSECEPSFACILLLSSASVNWGENWMKIEQTL